MELLAGSALRRFRQPMLIKRCMNTCDRGAATCETRSYMQNSPPVTTGGLFCPDSTDRA